MKYNIQAMEISDYEEVYNLWSKTEGLVLSPSDSETAFTFYINRNPGLSFVARNEEACIIGSVLCGHDGSKGYIRHLAVTDSYRKCGIGRNLVNRCLAKLKSEGIYKCTIFVKADNKQGTVFWELDNWQPRNELLAMSKVL